MIFLNLQFPKKSFRRLGVKCKVEIFSFVLNRPERYCLLPMKIYVVTYNGRRCLMAWRFKFTEIRS